MSKKVSKYNSDEISQDWEEKEKVIDDNGDVSFYNLVTAESTSKYSRLALATEMNNDVPVKCTNFGSSSTTEDILCDIDLSGKIAIITGANCGIGFETTKALASRAVHCILACRNCEKANRAIDDILLLQPNAKLTSIHCDLTRLESVNKFCVQFLGMNLDLHFLILNAAVNCLPFVLTEDGFETTFQVNHLAQFYLARLLESKLIDSAPSRVVVLSSESHRMSTLNANNIDTEWSKSNFISFMAYNDSKLCNILFANELHRRLYKHNVTVVSCHPGNMVNTNLQRYWWFMRLLYFIAGPFTKSINQAAATVIYSGIRPETEGHEGRYFNNCKECVASSSANDLQLAKLLWDKSQKLIDNVCDKFSK